MRLSDVADKFHRGWLEAKMSVFNAPCHLIECTECSGLGYVEYEDEFDSELFKKEHCNKCDQTGYVVADDFECDCDECHDEAFFVMANNEYVNRTTNIISAISRAAFYAAQTGKLTSVYKGNKGLSKQQAIYEVLQDGRWLTGDYEWLVSDLARPFNRGEENFEDPSYFNSAA